MPPGFFIPVAVNYSLAFLRTKTVTTPASAIKAAVAAVISVLSLASPVFGDETFELLDEDLEEDSLLDVVLSVEGVGKPACGSEYTVTEVPAGVRPLEFVSVLPDGTNQ